MIQKLVFTGLLTAVTLCATSCQSTLPTAADLDAYKVTFQQRAQPQYDELERQRASGAVDEYEYQARKQALDNQVQKNARDAAWARHDLAQSERKSMGLPTPDQPVAITAPNAMFGGVTTMGVGQNSNTAGTLYRPFTQNAQGGGGQIMRGSSIPNYSARNNSGSRYVR
ncbi:MAG: hypothetical protein KDK99_09985 [Verrucomicrobiales bacterium]|nr:hypothetical protein [Verrucomicrobiales bacterium]